MIRKFEAKYGYVWKRKNTDWVGSNILILGKYDDVENYEQIPEPIQEETEQQNILTNE